MKGVENINELPFDLPQVAQVRIIPATYPHHGEGFQLTVWFAGPFAVSNLDTYGRQMLCVEDILFGNFNWYVYARADYHRVPDRTPTPDCAHFGNASVTVWFPNEQLTRAALSRIVEVCGQVETGQPFPEEEVSPNLPKVVSAEIKLDTWGSKRKKGYNLKIDFDRDPNQGRFASVAAIRRIGDALDGIQIFQRGEVTSDCGHFFTNRVMKWYPTHRAAEAALTRVEELCGKAPTD